MGIMCLVATTAFAIKSRHDTRKWTSFILVGVLFTTFLFVLPTIPEKWSENRFLDIVHRVLASLLYSLKAVIGRHDLSQMESIAFTGWLKYAYIWICYAMFFVTPILTTTWLISFFGDFGEKIRYVFHFSKNSFIFSELNENSLAIARGIKNDKKQKHSAIVFCETKKAESSLLIKAKELGGMCFYKSCVTFNAGWFHKCYNFYLVSENEDKNVRQASQIIEKYNKKDKRYKEDKIIINAFAKSGTSIDIIESINQKNIKVRFIDHIALLCNQLIFENPLYNIPNEGKDISVMIVGCGRTGIQMLKTVVWAGQIDGYTLKVRAYDKNDKVKEKFFSQAPELDSDEYDIDFVTADISSSDFENKIGENLDATYVFIATDDDNLNLKTAACIRGIFRSQGKKYDNFPQILVRIRNDFKASSLKNNPYLEERNIKAFGNASDLFEGEIPFETKFEKLSLGVHLAYKGMLNFDSTNQDYVDACNEFYCKEYDRRSSMATALHISAKLVSCGIMKYYEHDLTSHIAKEFKNSKLHNEACVDKLAENEHARWNAFYRSEGYRSIGVEQLKAYAQLIHNHRDKYTKTHPCITEWDNLLSLSREYYDLSGVKKDFREYDYKIVKAIPEIIEFANK